LKSLILGIGNPILCDDGVGLHIASELDGLFDDVDVRTTTMIDLNLLDTLSDYNRLFIIDAIQTGTSSVGTVKKLPPGEASLHLSSSHGIHLFELLQLGRDLGYRVPEIGGIYGIEIGEGSVFGTKLSPELMSKKADIVREIIGDIRKAWAS
jgi:hydrogenase maturation protease